MDSSRGGYQHSGCLFTGDDKLGIWLVSKMLYRRLQAGLIPVQ